MDKKKLLASLNKVSSQQGVSAFVEELLAGVTLTELLTVNVRFLTTGTSFSPSANCKFMFIECIAGGGAGASAQGGASLWGSGGGGGGGSWAFKLLTAPFNASYPYAIGAGGAPNADGLGNGGAGGNTTFGTGPLVLANAGTGGQTTTIGGNSLANAIGGVGGTGGIGDYRMNGDDGAYGYRWSGTSGMGGQGGAAARGGGGGRAPINLAGRDGKLYGGGGGGCASATGTGYLGGAGAQGVIIVTEFCST